ncbi:MAG: hypothetical protein AB1861_29105 [Cyanobacteriota bacterium]
MSDLEQNLAFLVSRISQLEERQNILSKYVIGLKRQLDVLTEQLNARPELQQIESFQGALTKLSEELTNLQQRIPQTLALSKSLERGTTPNTPNKAAFEYSESVRLFVEQKIEQQQHQKEIAPPVIPQSGESVRE